MNHLWRQEIETYKQNHPKSNELWQQSRYLFPGGVSHNIRTLGFPHLGAFPNFVDSSHGPTITDVDGQTYIDYWMGHYTQILGHNNPVVHEAITNSLKKGWMVGTPVEDQINLANKIVGVSPSMEQVRFCTSGTEAIMYATRLARTYTGRSVVAKTNLGWHGANEISVPRHQLTHISREAASLEFPLDAEVITDLIRGASKDLAAVVIEPFIGGGGGFPVDLELLKLLREETTEHDVLLIFDEVVSGFRFHYGLLQDLIGVRPDLTTLGKIIGGGLPIGIYGGRGDVMELANPDSQARNVLVGGGTFSAHPLSLAAGNATLGELVRRSQDYLKISSLGQKLRDGASQLLLELGLHGLVTGQDSMVFCHLLNGPPEGLTIPQALTMLDREKESMLQLSLINRGVFGHHGFGALSMAHTDINTSLDALRSALMVLVDD